MGLPELKHKIQLQIENADERLLRIVSSVFDNYLNEESYNDFPTSSLALNKKELLNEALRQVREMKTLPHDSVMEETKKRYSKYFKNED
jgi:hypothetical protein